MDTARILTAGGTKAQLTEALALLQQWKHEGRFYAILYVLEGLFETFKKDSLRSKLGDVAYFQLYLCYAFGITNGSRSKSGKSVFQEIVEQTASESDPEILIVRMDAIFELINSSYEWLMHDTARIYIKMIDNLIGSLQKIRKLPQDPCQCEKYILTRQIEMLISSEQEEEQAETLFQNLEQIANTYHYDYERTFFKLRYAESLYFRNTSRALDMVNECKNCLLTLRGPEEKFYLWAKMDYAFLQFILKKPDADLKDMKAAHDALKKDCFNDYRKRLFALASVYYASGLVVLVLGILYMLVMRFMLKGDTQTPQREGWTRRTFRDLIREYRLTGRARRLAIRPGSPMIGQRLDDLKLRERYGANVIGVERWRRFRRVIVNVNGVSEFRARDVLLIDMSAADVDLRQFCSEQLLEPMVLRGEYFSDQALDVGMAEISLIPESELIGKSVREIGFRTRYGLNVVGLKRNGVALEGSLADEPLLLGDIILVVGNWKLIGMLAKQGRDFVALNLPEEVSEASPAHSQAPHAIFCLVLMVALMLTDEIPNPVAAIIACLLMGKFRCIDAESAYKSIHWPSIILIVGMMPFAVALQKTGGVALAVKGLMDIGGGYGPHMMLGCLFVLSAVIGLFISNTATAVLMAPIALAAAKTMGVSPYPFAMVVAMAASAAFMTPVSSPVNTLVLGPGNYSFSDFVKLGVPFTIIVMAVCVVMIPMLFPF